MAEVAAPYHPADFRGCLPRSAEVVAVVQYRPEVVALVHLACYLELRHLQTNIMSSRLLVNRLQDPQCLFSTTGAWLPSKQGIVKETNRTCTRFAARGFGVWVACAGPKPDVPVL